MAHRFNGLIKRKTEIGLCHGASKISQKRAQLARIHCDGMKRDSGVTAWPVSKIKASR